MKILILSTFGHYGGAATCSKRLFLALKNHGLDVDLRALQFYDKTEIRSLFRDTWINRIRIKFLFIIERLQVLLKVRSMRYLYKYSTGLTGFLISEHPLVRKADIIHLHWVNFGFISISEIARLARTKKVIWTQHDMWAFGGGFHYTCYQDEFGQGGVSQRVLGAKMKHWKKDLFHLMTTSRWLADCASKSEIFKDWPIDVLPTPIDVKKFRPLEKKEARQKFGIPADNYVVLFGAVDLGDERKGFSYLLEALNGLKKTLPKMHLVTFGEQSADLFVGNVTALGQVNVVDELNEIYNLADVFVLPSVQDNLPNTVMEAMSCGVPVVAFDSGGVGDMVDHKQNGYLAPNKDAGMLAEGILYFTNEQRRAKAGAAARDKIENSFSEEALVPRYRELYDQTIMNRG